jgi:iron(III) transport system substrate-binding protein
MIPSKSVDLSATVFLLALSAAALAVCAGCPRQPATGTAAQEVVVYCSVDEDAAMPILKEFEKTSGLKIVPRFDKESAKTTVLIQKIIDEAPRPVADVYWGGEAFHTVTLAKAGVLEPYEPEQAKSWPMGLADPQGLWYGFGLRTRVVAYNTTKVTEAEAPSRLEDLLDPKWKGRIAMGPPEFGTTSGHVASWYALYGEKRAEEIMRGLRANEIRLVGANSLAVQDVASGRAHLCITDTDDAYSAQRQGWPIAMKVLRHGDGGALPIPCTAALIKGGPHPEAARKLMALLLSADTERMLARSDLRCLPLRAEVRKEFPDIPDLGVPLAVDFGKVSEFLPIAMKKAPKILKD